MEEQNSPLAPIPKTQERERTIRHGRPMPHYHFDLVDWKGVADQGVADRSNDIEAMDSADAMARRLLGARPDLRKRYCAILVTNDEGKEVFRLPLDIIH